MTRLHMKILFDFVETSSPLTWPPLYYQLLLVQLPFQGS